MEISSWRTIDSRRSIQPKQSEKRFYLHRNKKINTDSVPPEGMQVLAAGALTVWSRDFVKHISFDDEYSTGNKKLEIRSVWNYRKITQH